MTQHIQRFDPYRFGGDFDDDEQLDDGMTLFGEDLYAGEEEILGADPMTLLTPYERNAAAAIFGYDQIIGADAGGGSQLARQNAALKAQLAKLQRVALARAAGGAAVVQRSRRQSFRQLLPMDQPLVAAGAIVTITMQPQRLFRPERLTVASEIAEFFNILQFNVGATPQFVSPGPVPAQILSEVGVQVQLSGDTANLGNLVTLQVHNIDGDPHLFKATLIGTVVN